MRCGLPGPSLKGCTDTPLRLHHTVKHTQYGIRWGRAELVVRAPHLKRAISPRLTVLLPTPEDVPATTMTAGCLSLIVKVELSSLAMSYSCFVQSRTLQRAAVAATG